MDAIRVLSALFGIAFVLAGIAGFLPNFVTDGKLLGIFEVDSMHNMVHLLSGVIALLAASRSSYARLYFQIFGILYGIVAVVGFVRGGDLFMMHVNMADNILHLVIAVVALYIGFVFKKSA